MDMDVVQLLAHQIAAKQLAEIIPIAPRIMADY
jgi:hypothetical protein